MSSSTDKERLLGIVLANPVARTILDRAPDLGMSDWYLTAGGVFQTVWNHLDDRDLRAGIKDYEIHLWSEDRFGVRGVPFTSCADAIDHFASTTCCVGITRSPTGELQVYAPHGLDDLFSMVLRPNPILAPREVYEAKAARWQREWPGLTVLPWPDAPTQPVPPT
jgi:uncharacterized protein